MFCDFCLYEFPLLEQCHFCNNNMRLCDICMSKHLEFHILKDEKKQNSNIDERRFLSKVLVKDDAIKNTGIF
jgi:hypothetical protein